MEEIVTVDGRQFKLMTDRPLTAQEKAQAMTEIRKQAGCGTCGPRAVMTSDPNWRYGGTVRALPFGNDGAGTNSIVGTKGSGSTINLAATPNGGVAPYDVRFWYSLNGVAITQVGVDHLAAPENVAVTDSYVVTDGDVAGALGGGGALAPTDVNTTTGAISTTGGGAAALVAGSIRFYTSIVDSCSGAGGKGTCAQYVDVAITCVAPTCGFVVT